MGKLQILLLSSLFLSSSAAALLVGPTPAAARSTCAPLGADAEPIAGARQEIEAACPCDAFPRHSSYTACTRRVIRRHIESAALSRACGRLVGRMHARSTCSFARPRVTCCVEGNDGTTECRVRLPRRCADRGDLTARPCGEARFCADLPCGAASFGLDAPGCDDEQLLYSPEGNRLRRYDLDTVDPGPVVDDILIENAGSASHGRDINGQVCFLADGSGRFVAGEDTGQPNPPAGWGIFGPDGTQLGKLTATYFTASAEPFGCAVTPDGRLFTSEVGSQATGPFDGQLILWFPPFDGFPGPPGAYPATNDASTNFCKIATDIGTAGSIALDSQGRVYVASARGGVVHRFSPPFPTGPDAAGGCGSADATGAPLATNVRREVFAAAITATGISAAPGGRWYVSSVLTGTIGEFDAAGNHLRDVLAPTPGGGAFPLDVGHPQGLAVDCRGRLHYADLDLRVRPSGIGPGPNGSVRQIDFDSCGTPQAPVVLRDGLRFPDGLGITSGDLETP